jgi:hypothetical protein
MPLRHGEQAKLNFRVRLRIENLPVHAWSEEVVAQVIGDQCAIHYVGEYSRRCDRTRTYDLWAWCADPTKVSKRVLLTIVDPDSEQVNNRYEFLHDPPADHKGAFDYELKLHLEVVEDLLFLHGGGRDAPPNRKPRREFIWSYGATTGEAIFPECHVLPRVPKIGFPECCTRGRRAHGQEKLHLTAQIDGAV